MVTIDGDHVGEVFPVAGGWQWRVHEDAERGIPARDTEAACRRPYLAQAEAEEQALRHVRCALRSARAKKVVAA